MSDHLASSERFAAARIAIRNPANLRLGLRPRAVAARLPAAAHVETVAIGALLAAVASALPLVMMLHQ